MRVLAFFVAFVSIGAVASPCLAQDDEPPAPHIGIAVGGVMGLANNGASGDSPFVFGRSTPPAKGTWINAGAANPTFQLDLGVRIHRYISIYARGEAGTIVLASQAAAYAIVEWRPVPHVSLGTGIGADAMTFYSWSGWSGVSIPLVAAVDVASLSRGALRVGFEGAAGVEPSTSTYGWHTALTFGWVLN